MNIRPTSLALSIMVLKIIAWINIIIFFIFFGNYIYATVIEPESTQTSIMLSKKLLGAFEGLFLAILLYFTTKGLSEEKKWSRIITMILGVLMVFGFPIGTIIGALLIYATTKGWPKKADNITNEK
jgi:hypothetical protein